jgi:hypothetical protein
MLRGTRIGLLAGLVAAVSLTALAYYRGWLSAPPEYNPWAPLDVGAPINFLTRYKLSRLSNDAELCQRILSQTHLTYEALDDLVTGPSCGLQNAIRVDRTSSAVTSPFSLTCRAAVSLALWESHFVQPAAQTHFGARVAKLEHFGSYSCRNVYGRPNATRSRHATAEALDVAGFVLENDQRIRILGSWNENSRESRFLHDVRDGACKVFDGVLSPDYNEAHRDHLHLDRGPYRVCR